MRSYRNLKTMLVLTLLIGSLSLLFGCGSGGSSDPTPAVNTGTTGAHGMIGGSAVKGPINGGTVTAYSISNGTMGAQLATGTTDIQGNFNISIGDYTGPIMFQMSGGTYIDEATGLTVTMSPGDVMTAVVTSFFTGATVTGIRITPLTSMAQAMANNMAGGMIDANITAANTAIGNYFMVNDILHTQPMNPLVSGSSTTATQDMRNYGMAIAAMTQYAKNIGMTSSSGIVTSMMNDASDGVLNGMMGNTQIALVGMGGGMMGGGYMMQPTAGTSGLASALTQFTGSAMNQSGLTLSGMQTLMDHFNSSNGQLWGPGGMMTGGTGTVIVTGGAGTGMMTGGTVTVTVNGGTGTGMMTGGTGTVFVTGMSGTGMMTGGTVTVTVNGGTGTGMMTGGTGTVFVTGGTGTVIITGGTGTSGTMMNGLISGSAFNGHMTAGTVMAYAINNGTIGAQIASGATDTQGNFTMSLGSYSGPVMFKVSGGSYMDLVTGTIMTMLSGDVMTAVIPTITSGATITGIRMTPLTSMAQARAQAMSGGMTDANITAANTAIGSYFMVSNILETMPMNAAVSGSGGTATTDMRNYGIAIAAMSQYARTIGMTDPAALITNMMNDASDGILNGMMGSTQITVGSMMGGGMMGGGGTMMQSTAGTSGLATAMTTFMGSAANQSGLSAANMQTLINTLAASNGTI